MTNNCEQPTSWDDTVSVAESALTLASDLDFNGRYNNGHIYGVYGQRRLDDYEIEKKYSDLNIIVLTSAGKYAAELIGITSPARRRLNGASRDEVSVTRWNENAGKYTHTFTEAHREKASLLIARLAAKAVMRDATTKVEGHRTLYEEGAMAIKKMHM